MFTFTPDQSASARTLGIRSPGRSRPEAISARRRQASCTESGSSSAASVANGVVARCECAIHPHNIVAYCASQLAHRAVASLARMRVERTIYEEMVAHARDELPNESCGMLATSDGRLSAFFPAANEFASPMRFRIDAADQIRIYNEIAARGEDVAIFHSHPKTEARPSQTDINLAADWPGAVWVICSLSDQGTPVVRAFLIDGGEVEELELVVE